MEKAHTGARYDTIHRHARLGACGLERVAVGINLKKAGIFGGRSAIERMASGNVADLNVVRQYIDAQLSNQRK